MAWHQELLIGFDLETTGTEPREVWRTVLDDQRSRRRLRVPEKAS